MTKQGCGHHTGHRGPRHLSPMRELAPTVSHEQTALERVLAEAERDDDVIALLRFGSSVNP